MTTPETQQLIDCALNAAADKLAGNPVLIDVSQRLAIAECFLVLSAPSQRQVRAIAEEVMDEIGRELKIIPTRIEGRAEGQWVLVDYEDLVVHVMSDEDREFYALEKLWGEGEVRQLELPQRHVIPGLAQQHQPVSAADVASGAF